MPRKNKKLLHREAIAKKGAERRWGIGNCVNENIPPAETISPILPISTTSVEIEDTEEASAPTVYSVTNSHKRKQTFDCKQDFLDEVDVQPVPIVTTIQRRNSMDENAAKRIRRKSGGENFKTFEISGRRIISVNSLNFMIQEISTHSMTCLRGPIKCIDEKRVGLNSDLVYMCGCGKLFYSSSNSPELSLEGNEGLAWGCQVSATGFTSAVSLLTTLDIPCPATSTFLRCQNSLQETLIAATRAEMKKWAAREKELTSEANEFVTVEGKSYPAVTVILDGGWAKRSYGHSYSSKCGVAVIIGAKTRKVIYADVKISSCSVCDLKRTNEIPPHRCCKNWNGPPTGMESAILLEGFMNSIKEYGVVYSSFIGDGDSSVYAKVRDIYPGIEVKKVECKNHVVRNFTTKLMDIATNRVKGSDSKIPADERRLVNPKLVRFRVALRQAIKYNSENGSDFKELRHDIANIPMHVFGNHSNCRGYYQCNKNEPDLVPVVSKMNFWSPLMRAIDRVAGLSSSLIYNQTSNSAESFMSVASKYVEGKRKHFGQRGLYKLRMAGAVLSYNESSFWANEVYKYIQGNDCTSKLWIRRHEASLKRRQRKQKYRVKKPLKFPLLAERKGDLEYGSHPQTPDMDAGTLEMEILCFKSKLQVTREQCQEIETSTRGQSLNPEWFRQRYGRITASFAPSVYKLKTTTSNKAVLDDYFKRKRLVKIVERAMLYGKNNEKRAIEDYQRYMNLTPGTVQEVGLIVCPETGVLAASPDGLIGGDGLIEIKCPYSLSAESNKGQSVSPSQWPDISTSSSLKRDKKSGQLHLNPAHDHYRQIIMQLHISNRSWCDYVIWSENGLYVERIQRSPDTEALWLKMKEKLLLFWKLDLAPEVVNSRFERGYKEYRSPPSRVKK